MIFNLSVEQIFVKNNNIDGIHLRFFPVLFWSNLFKEENANLSLENNERKRSMIIDANIYREI